MNGNNRNFFDDNSYYEPSRRSNNFQVKIDDSRLDQDYDPADYRSTAVRTRD